MQAESQGDCDTGDDQQTLPASNKWLVLLVAVLLQMVVFGSFVYSFTFWVAPWSEEFGVGRTTILTIPTLFLYATSGAAFLLGSYIDKLPQRTIASVGLAFYVIAMLGIAFAPSISVVFLIYALLVPISCTLAGPIAAIAFVSQVFDKQRGLAIGLVTMGTSLGGMTIPNVAAILMADGGWRETHITLAISALLLFPAVLTVLKFKPRPHPGGPASLAAGSGNLQFLKRRDMWVCIAAFMLTYFVFIAVQFNMAPLAADLGVSLQGTAMSVTVLTLGMVIGKVLTGYVSDKVDPRLVFVGICCALFVALAIILVNPPFILLLMAFGIMGLGSGGLIPLKGALLADIFGSENVGRTLGVSAPFIAAYGFGPVYAGWVRDTTGSYFPALYTLLVLAALAAPLIFLLKRREPGHALA